MAKVAKNRSLFIFWNLTSNSGTRRQPVGNSIMKHDFCSITKMTEAYSDSCLVHQVSSWIDSSLISFYGKRNERKKKWFVWLLGIKPRLLISFHNINFCPKLLPFCIAQQLEAIISSWSCENSEPFSSLHLLSPLFQLFWGPLFNSRDLVLKESSLFNSSASTQSRGHLCMDITEVRTSL